MSTRRRWTCVVLGVPRPQGSKRFVGVQNGRGKMIESSRHLAAWRRSIVYAASACARGVRFSGPVVVSMVFSMPAPRRVVDRNARPSSRPDLSKLIRAVEDALVDAGVLVDDARIVEYSRAAKVYAGSGDVDALRCPGVRIVIEELR